MTTDQRRARRGLEVYLWLICQSFFLLSSQQDQASQEQEVAFCTTDQSASKKKRRDRGCLSEWKEAKYMLQLYLPQQQFPKLISLPLG